MSVTELHLLAVRAQLRATLALLDLALGAQDAPPDHPAPAREGCPHPHEQRIPAGRMGAPHAYLCLACGVTGGLETSGNPAA